MRLHRIPALILTALTACGPTAPPPEVASQPNPAFIKVCGPRESYEYIARDFQCPETGNPFAGNIEQARAARTGSVGSHPLSTEDEQAKLNAEEVLHAHVVDRYVVPCARGPVEVFICMYHCQEGRTVMD